MAQDPVVEEAVEDVPAKKSSKKLIIIIVSAIFLLSAIGGGIAWFLSGNKSGDHKVTKEEKADKEEGNETEEDKEAEAPATPQFLKLDTFTVNLNPDDGEKYLQVDITLNASTKEEADLLALHMPQLRNRVLMILTSKMASEISGMEGKKQLSLELTEQINQPYTKDGKPLKVTDVFFTSFVIQ